MSSIQKVTFMIQCLSGQVYDRAEAIRRRDRELIMSYGEFLTQFQAVIDHPDQVQSNSHQLLSLRQGSSQVSDYAIEFQLLTSKSSWSKPVHIAAFCYRLSADFSRYHSRPAPER